MQLDSIPQERKILENKRLDLDACKNKVRKARAMQLQPPVSLSSTVYLTKPDAIHGIWIRTL